MTDKEQIITNYIDGYNNSDVSKMMKDFSEDIIFENLQEGIITLRLNGLEEFRKQAEAAKGYFSERRQTIKYFTHKADQTEIGIDYFAVLAIDFPNGLKKGQEIYLTGKSIFQFHYGKIIGLTDIS